MSNRKIYAIIAVALAVFWCCVLSLVLAFMPRGKTIDCSRAAFHPYYTVKMRQLCRGQA